MVYSMNYINPDILKYIQIPSNICLIVNIYKIDILIIEEKYIFLSLTHSYNIMHDKY